ncbi:bifunctional methylenetetrahydrofolate dehydrogenase/methenyltetrahydrofolate cyclohydrolase FolD [Methylocapsa sp. D3K7]|uniref:bifunctional 5,10-methylenetetrahydrofolate dehydrogenase/5,10-methenyltetrahydrofolate cyclohydrolase n=1 Tax=Methylocapsa sp. D3K7 TaxID=3041435 RepID=UPI00244EB504|nr:bifunctional methylenetetrahydrofolate dehydrogenase/methenyltetrahydrofolate cyclohydrolase FolD [Methylocapsa sp. D3K7]WGJ14494.1 bifunctional methylenetetrahydrofolate dehydrogenase/methenyltetrahydrofolate cyclohydrolase FolD [Methylocapsa sp. D3K7]
MLEVHAPTGCAVIDGKRASKRVLARVTEVARSLAAQGLRPGLAVILVGEDPASQVYVKSKGKAAHACGFHSIQHDLAATVSEEELLALVETLNADPAIHGILLQLPLPRPLDPGRVIDAISPGKDVDGLHPVNAGLLASGDMKRALVPCTPAGSMVLLDMAAEALGVKLSGAEAVVVGRSNLVGKPIAQLLLGRNATVTIAHSRTLGLAATVARADVVIAAVGRPEMIRGAWIKPGAIVIDVGINRMPGEGLNASGMPKTKLVGDVAFAETIERAGAITPVPGGVGPMTIAMLMENTLRAALLSSGRTPSF